MNMEYLPEDPAMLTAGRAEQNSASQRLPSDGQSAGESRRRKSPPTKKFIIKLELKDVV